MADFEYSKYIAAFIRFERALVAQLPAIAAALLTFSKTVELPIWIIPSLSLLGAFLQALDKLYRDWKKGL